MYRRHGLRPGFYFGTYGSVHTTRVRGPCSRAPANTICKHGPSTRPVNTGVILHTRERGSSRRPVITGSAKGAPVWTSSLLIMTSLLLHRSQERLRSIVMNSSVCLSVCPTGYLPNTTRNLYQIFMHVAYCRGSVLLRRIDDRLHRLSR